MGSEMCIRDRDQSVLMIFIRPTILENSFDNEQATQRQFDFLRTHDSQYFLDSGEEASPILREFFNIDDEEAAE